MATTKPGWDSRLPRAHGVGFITDWTTCCPTIAGLAAMQLPKFFRHAIFPVFAWIARNSPCWLATKTRLSATDGGNSMYWCVSTVQSRLNGGRWLKVGGEVSARGVVAVLRPGRSFTTRRGRFFLPGACPVMNSIEDEPRTVLVFVWSW